MDVMQTSNTEMRESSTPSVKLRTEVFDALMNAKGITSLDAQARELEVNRSTLFRVRTGRVEPSAGLTLRMARLAGTSVEALFELRQGSDIRV